MQSRNRIVAALAIAIAATAAAAPSQAEITWVNQFTDAPGQGFFDPTFGADRQAAFIAAENIWSNYILPSHLNETITVSASFPALGGTATSAPLGSAGHATSHFNFASANPDYKPNTIYVGALANHLAGQNLDPANSAQIQAVFNSTLDTGTVANGFTFYYGTDANPGAGKVDFVTVAMHELAHGLGFFPSIQSTGKFQVEYFLPNAYDRFLYRGADDTYLAARPDTPEGDAARAADIRSGDLYFRGPATMLVGGLDGVELYAPSTFSLGATGSHIDPLDPIDLMNRGYRGVNHTPSLSDLAILSDIGWTITTPIPEPTTLTLLAPLTLALLSRRTRNVRKF
jgi:hypothetical protein